MKKWAAALPLHYSSLATRTETPTRRVVIIALKQTQHGTTFYNSTYKPTPAVRGLGWYVYTEWPENFYLHRTALLPNK